MLHDAEDAMRTVGPSGSAAPHLHLGGYKASMRRLLAYVGLEGYGTPHARMPPRTAEETARIEEHMEAALAAAKLHEERNKNRRFQNMQRMPSALEGLLQDVERDDTATIYLSLEDTLEWRAFMASIPSDARHTATARRRLSLILWRACRKGTCLWCWLPAGNCICDKLEAYRLKMPADALHSCSPVTMLLHAEELMRSTNTGHIAAFLLDAPIRVWGVPEDDAFLRDLTAVEEHPSAGADAASGPPRAAIRHVSLYPAAGAQTIADFIGTHLGDETGGLSPSPAPLKENTDLPQQSEHATEQQQRVHLVLLDSTWPQAHSLNRHIAKAVPRVALEIPESYEARFARLRKRTRETGVSTLEATSMAVEQCLTALGRGEDAALATGQLTAAMEEFVDIKCLLKFTHVEFDTDAAAVERITEQRDVARKEESQRRLALLEEKIRVDGEARLLLQPPVLNYCYCCERMIGWHRMAEHVMGKAHRAALVTNPHCIPSEASRTAVVPDYSRPMRQERVAATTPPQP